MYDLGLFSRKIITTGPLAGQQISTAEMAALRTPPTAVEWRNAKSKLKKCTHPGKDKVTKPAVHGIGSVGFYGRDQRHHF